MKLRLFQIDAFSDRLFEGNPAAVVPLESWLPDAFLQSIASENNLSETAFFVPSEPEFHLRWFTPACEGDLSGHATLVSAHVLFRHLGYPGNSLVFDTRSGDLIVEEKNGLLVMDFPDGSNEIRRACDGKKDSVSCEMDGSPKRFFTCSSSSCETLQIPVRHQRNEDPGRRNRE